MKTQFIIRELRSLAEDLCAIANDIEQEEARYDEIERQAKENRRKNPREPIPMVARPWPLGGKGNWKYLRHKFDNLFEGATGIEPVKIQI